MGKFTEEERAKHERLIYHTQRGGFIGIPLLTVHGGRQWKIYLTYSAEICVKENNKSKIKKVPAGAHVYFNSNQVYFF